MLPSTDRRRASESIEELTAGDHLVAFGQSLDDFDLRRPMSAPSVTSRGSNGPSPVRTMTTARVPGADDRLGRHDQPGRRRARDLQTQQHPGRQPAATVVDLEAGLQRARGRADLGQDFLQLVPVKRLRRVGLQRRP